MNKLTEVSAKNGCKATCNHYRKWSYPCFLFLLTFFLTSSVQAKYSGGTGEPNNPYQISDANDMNDIGNHPEDWDKHFVMVNDINLADYTGTEFNIIGDYDGTCFSGVFDGNGRTISNFTYNCANGNYIGLFGGVEGDPAVIKNLGLINPDVNVGTGYYAGALIGVLSCADIWCCFVEGGNVSGDNWVGGLVGSDVFGTLTYCYSTCSVSGNNNVGGLTGHNLWSTISKCYSTGSVGVWGNDNVVGGLVGLNGSDIINCYSRGLVLGNDCIGGLVGQNGGWILRCYSTGGAYGSSGNDGGLVAFNSGTVTDSFWDTETSGQATSVGGTGKTTAEMQTQSTFTDAGWDFVGETANGASDIWTVHEDVDYPKLVWKIVNFVGWYEVDFADFGYFANYWGDENCGTSNDCGGADLDFSDTVDIKDLKIFLDHWLAGVE